MPRVLKWFNEGDVIPDGAMFIRSKFVNGDYIGEEIVARWGIFPFNGVTYRNRYRQVPMYLYEVDEPTKEEVACDIDHESPIMKLTRRLDPGEVPYLCKECREQFTFECVSTWARD